MTQPRKRSGTEFVAMSTDRWSIDNAGYIAREKALYDKMCALNRDNPDMSSLEMWFRLRDKEEAMSELRALIAREDAS